MRTLIIFLTVILISGCSREEAPKHGVFVQPQKLVQAPKQTGSFTVELAETYIQRAIYLCDKHMQQDEFFRESYKNLLRSMVVKEVGLYAEMDSATVDSTKMALFTLAQQGKFILALRDFSGLNTDPHKKAGMTFERKIFDVSQGTVFMIEADRDMVDYSSDIDINACILLHELTHAIQAHLAMQKHPGFIDNYIGNENAAWQNQCNIYFAEHPEMLDPVVAVDCDNFGDIQYKEGYSESSLPDIGPRHIYFSMLYYKACGREYLKRVYEVKE